MKEIFLDIYQRLKNNGKLVSPRGMKVLEVENFSISLPPLCRFSNFKVRKLSVNYIKKEFLWYLKGDKFDTSIVNHAKLWKQFINSDGVINSNYGQYIFWSCHEHGRKSQFEFVVEELTRDRDSRRAVITILQPYHTVIDDLTDVPCTYSLGFRVRDNKLNMSSHMRSQDAIYGLGNDIPAFSFVQEMVYAKLKDTYKDLEMGSHYHVVDSLHVYEKHFQMLDDILSNPEFEDVECPRIKDSTEVDYLIAHNYDGIPSDYQFTHWLSPEQKESLWIV